MASASTPHSAFRTALANRLSITAPMISHRHMFVKPFLWLLFQKYKALTLRKKRATRAGGATSRSDRTSVARRFALST